MQELFDKFDILHDKLLNNGRIFQAHYIDICKRAVSSSKEDGRVDLVRILVDLIKKKPHGYQDAMNVVAACLALYQGVKDGGSEIKN